MDVSINKRFSEIRKHLKLTQKAMASKLSVSQGTITDIERCRIGVSSKIIEKMSIDLGVNKSWLYTGEGSPFYSEQENSLFTTIQGENTGKDTGYSSSERRKQTTKRGIELSGRLGNSEEAIFNGYYEDNKLAYYLRHTDVRLDGLLSNAISDLKDLHNAIRKLTTFSSNVGAPDFIEERFEEMPEFDSYKNELDSEFDETYQYIKDEKVLKCTRIISYEEDIGHNTRQLINMIDYIDRYDDFFTGHKDYKNAN